MARPPTANPRARIALAAGALVFAGLALASGLDRMSATRPELARLVPTMFASEAHAARVPSLLRAGQADASVEAARAALAADPLDMGDAGRLGAVALLTGERDLADRAFSTALRLGWRDPATQAWFFAGDMRVRDYAAAAQRLDVLMRTDARFPGGDALLAELEARPEARGALAEVLERGPAWWADYLRPEGRLASEALVRRAAFLASAAAPQVGCDGAAAIAGELVESGERRAAERLWATQCPTQRIAGGIADTTFAGLRSETASPFGWRRVRSGDAAVRVDGASLTLANRAPASKLALVQRVAFGPSEVRVRVNGDAKGDRALLVSLDCDDTPRLPGRVRGDALAGGQVLTVPADCPDQLLGLWVRGRSEGVRLERISAE